MAASCRNSRDYSGPSGSGESWFEPRRGNSRVRRCFGGVGPFHLCAHCYRFSSALTNRRLTSLTGDSITCNIVPWWTVGSSSEAWPHPPAAHRTHVLEREVPSFRGPIPPKAWWRPLQQRAKAPHRIDGEPSAVPAPAGEFAARDQMIALRSSPGPLRGAAVSLMTGSVLDRESFPSRYRPSCPIAR